MLSDMLRDSIDGSLSSRRVVTLSAFLLCAIAFVMDLFYNIKMEKFIFDSMSYIAIAGLGATVAEKFSSRESMGNVNFYDYQSNGYGYQGNYNNRYQPPPTYQTGNRQRTPLPTEHEPLI